MNYGLVHCLQGDQKFGRVLQTEIQIEYWVHMNKFLKNSLLLKEGKIIELTVVEIALLCNVF